MSSRIGAYEKRLGEMTSETTAQGIFTAPLAASNNRVPNDGTTQSQPMSAALDNFLDMAEEVRTRVANQLRGTPVLPVHIYEDTASEDELEPPTRKKRTLRIG